MSISGKNKEVSVQYTKQQKSKAKIYWQMGYGQRWPLNIVKFHTFRRKKYKKMRNDTLKVSNLYSRNMIQNFVEKVCFISRSAFSNLSDMFSNLLPCWIRINASSDKCVWNFMSLVYSGLCSLTLNVPVLYRAWIWLSEGTVITEKLYTYPHFCGYQWSHIIIMDDMTAFKTYCGIFER